MSDGTYSPKSVSGATGKPETFKAGMVALQAEVQVGFSAAFSKLKNHARLESARINRKSEVPEIAQTAKDALTSVIAAAAREGLSEKEEFKRALRELERTA